MSKPEAILRVFNSSKGLLLADSARRADSYWERLKGLLGTDELPSGSALIIPQCRSVHMFGMRYPIDVVFCASDGAVVGVESNLRPWRVSKHYSKASYVIELPSGIVRSTNTTPGDLVTLKPIG